MKKLVYYTHSAYPNTIYFPWGKIQGKEIWKNIERLGFVPKNTGCCSKVSSLVVDPWSDNLSDYADPAHIPEILNY